MFWLLLKPVVCGFMFKIQITEEKQQQQKETLDYGICQFQATNMMLLNMNLERNVHNQLLRFKMVPAPQWLK